MLAVRERYRGKGVASKLVRMALDAMIERDADEVSAVGDFVCFFVENGLLQIALETEVTNTAAIKLYQRLGFLKSKRLHRYYLNGNSAFRFMLPLKGRAATYADEDGDSPRLSERSPSV